MGIKADPKGKQTTPDKVNGIFQPNILDYFDNTAYHFKLYMLPFTDIAARKYNSSSKTLLAQSGVTSDVNITSIDYESYLGMSERYSSGTALSFDIVLTEPHGSTVLDRMARYAADTKVENYQRIPYFLELSFKGHANDEYDMMEQIRDKVWRWRLVFMKIDMTINASGTVYRIKAQAYNDTALNDVNGVINEVASIDAATVGEYFEKLAESLNKKDDTGNEKTANKWSFFFEKPIAEQPLVIADSDATANSSATFSAGTASGSTRIAFNKNTSIIRILETVLGNTEYFQKLVRQSDTASGSVDEESKQKDKFAQLFRVYSTADILSYDADLNSYVQEFSYYVKHYSIPSLFHEPPIPENSIYRLNNLISEGFLKKKYDYVFTGLNDQVLDFDMKFDFSFFYGTPKQQGVSINPGANTQSATKDVAPVAAAVIAEKKQEKAPMAAQTNNNSAATVAPPVIRSGKDTHTAVSMGMTTSTNDGLSVLSSLFNQAKTGDMYKVSMDIKGDPFWLEPAPITLNTEDTGGDTIVEYTDRFSENSVFSKNGRVFVLFTAKTPSIDQADGGILRDSTSLSGIYTVAKVRHSFAQTGRFTQSLELWREFSIDTTQPDVMATLRGAEVKPPKKTIEVNTQLAGESTTDLSGAA